LESHLEARLWNDVFIFAQDALGMPRGTIRATVLIETILAAFETDEILWELRDHSAGLNCGRWDYIFSYIKKLRRRPECVLPGRGRTCASRRAPCSRPRPGRSLRTACARTSASRCSTSRGGSAAWAACRSTTSWRTPRRPRSPARRCGSGCATARTCRTVDP